MVHKIRKRETKWKQIGESCLRGQKRNGIKLISSFKQLMYVSCLGFLSRPRKKLLHGMSKQVLSPSRGRVTVKSVPNVYCSIEEGCISMWWLRVRLRNQHTLKNMSEYYIWIYFLILDLFVWMRVKVFLGLLNLSEFMIWNRTILITKYIQ